MLFVIQGKEITNVSEFNKRATAVYSGLSDEDRLKLKEQAEVTCSTTFYLTKKKIKLEGRQIMMNIGKEVSIDHIAYLFIIIFS